jgi:hypothetical protein
VTNVMQLALVLLLVLLLSLLAQQGVGGAREAIA